MNWKIEDVVNALQNKNYPKLDNTKDLALQLFDPGITCGVGIDNLGRRVLVLPGQEFASSFVTKNAEFDPWSSVKWIDSDQILPQVSTLRCEANFNNRSICEAIAVIFIGLINIQLKYGSAGSAGSAVLDVSDLSDASGATGWEWASQDDFAEMC